MRTSPAAVYVAGVASSRPLFRELVKVALGQLPSPCHGKGSERLIVFDSMAKLGKALGVGRTTVRGDLERLVNYRWITIEDDGYLLGHRNGWTLNLLADVAGRDELGDDAVVSRMVISDMIVSEPAPQERESVRGAGRRWRPDE